MRPTKATVRLDAMVNNLQVARHLAPQSKIMAVIKANAYGHGVVAVARTLQNSVPAFAVAFFEEAVALRDAGITQPILVLQGSTTDSDVAEAAAKNFCLMLHSLQQVERVLNAKLNKPVQAWIKVDTGMHRLGLNACELNDNVQRLSASSNVQQNMVLCTHLACADEPDNPMTKLQINLASEYAGKYALPLSIANSAGIMSWPQSHADWVRPGYMLYGNSPIISESSSEAGLIPAMSMESKIISIRELAAGEGVGYGQKWKATKPSKIGTIPIGYGDGYPRHATNETPVLVNGYRVLLAGSVSMDMISVDLSGLDQVEVGDPVELWGANLSVNEVAESAGTIGYEVLAGLSGRVPVIYTP